ncbi:amino acid adenylation domain-containing protein [Flavobacterium sp. LS1R47]|uniref:Amino acid adenylation domain-containing protein n=1 Tax=Flavobacterium frigoritolerans TaxID=2987686 RepID=A0A9X3CAL3_9FLAO|nr:non-ribosomal peptide synthetase [Flavobacterium frigoritolerans]MCV9934616.1 amino acid adenylation domain-containing protein [Flavobacterium frigoritolerans]
MKKNLNYSNISEKTTNVLENNHSILSTEEYNKIIFEWNTTDKEYPKNKTIQELFQEQVEKTPNSIALECEGKELTYNELNQRSNQLARHIRAQYRIRTKRSLTSDTLIGLCLDRSLEMVIGMLAVLKAGGAYVPMDSSYPKERIDYILDDTRLEILLTQRHLIEVSGNQFPKLDVIHIDLNEELYEEESKVNLPEHSAFNNLAYVIYTSGTTGKPKGVLINNQSVVNLINFHNERYSKLSNCLQVALLSNYIFDFSVQQIFSTILFGHKLHIISNSLLLSPIEFNTYLKVNKIEVFEITPILFSHLILPFDNYHDFNLKLINIGGENLLTATISNFLRKNLPSELLIINTYGPTEYTVDATCFEINGTSKLSELQKNIPIGKPLDNTRIYILDLNNSPVPVGVIGELHIGGAGLARGYLNRPELTAERFIVNPFATAADKANGYTHLYKTGDLVKWRADGNIEYIGRNDDQVKIRGHRVEIGEIEHEMCQVDGIKQACVLVKERKTETSNIKYLVGYYVSDYDITSIDIQNRLLEVLPDYMIPTALVAMESFPLTINGKLDKRALPDPEFTSSKVDYVAPTTERETAVCEIWMVLMGLDQVGITDDFFRLGGDSILAIQVSHGMSKLLDCHVKVADIFKYKSIAQLLIHATGQSQLIIPKINSNKVALSFAQERLWFLDQYEAGSSAYHLPEIYELDINADKDGIKYAFQQIVIRHEILRTTIEQVGDLGQGMQVVHDDPLIIDEISLMDKESYELLIKEDINRPFDLSKEYPIRVKFYTIKSNGQVDKTFLLLNIHHIASDGWSTNILEDELFAFYEAYINKDATFNLPALEIQYKDYALWQRSYLTEEILEKQLCYWREKLSGYQTLEFPTDYTRPAKIDYKGADHDFVISREISQKLRKLCKYYEVTLHSLLLSSINILFSKYTEHYDIVIGSLNANRQQRQTEGLVGFFVNTQVNRALLSKSQSFKELIQEVQRDQIEAQLHQDLPFEKLVNDLGIDRDVSRHPIFQVLFGVQGFGQENKNSEQQKNYLKPYKTDDVYLNARFDLIITIDDRDEEILGKVNFATSLFHKDTIARFAQHYLYLLEQLSESPDMPYSQLSLLSPDEYNQVVHHWNATDKEYARDKSIIDIFEEQVKKTPNNIAIVFEEKELTYQQLDEESNKLAHYLIANYDTQANDLIGIMLDRSEMMLIAIFGILKAGAAYVCIDPEYPLPRKEFIIEDASLKILITQTDYIFDLEFYNGNVFAIDVQLDSIDTPIQYKKRVIKSDDLAYVIYTSGTTGTPKGVMIEHSAILSLICNDYITLSTNEVFAFLSSPAFDASTFEIYTPLLNGNKLIIPKELNTIISDTKEFKTFLALNKISVLWLTKTLFENLYYLDNSLFGNLNYLIIGGEALDKNTVNKLIGSSLKPKHFINGYGPTESTTFACTYNMVNQIVGRTVPIGKPINNRSIYILDSNYSPVPIGAIGELYIGGAGLARGYLKRPELTAERFITNPFATELGQDKGHTRLYKTGDLVRRLADGNIEYISRIDDQVKIRGYRIELGEIEHAISQIKGIKQVHVLAKERQTETGNTKYLVAYYVLEDSNKIFDEAIILENLSQVLPHYMVPASFVAMEFFPYTINGKLDSNALPDPNFSTLSEEFVAPVTETEKAICNIWQDVLGLERVGITDDFFRIGGDSILSIRLVSKIRQLGFNISVQEIFKYKIIQDILPKIVKVDFLNEIDYKPFSLISSELKSSILKDNNLQLDQLQDIYPASYLQSGMLIESLVEDRNDTYHDVLSYVINKKFDNNHFQKIWSDLIAKHENLRSEFVSNEEGYFNVIHTSIDINSKIKLLSKQDNLEQIVNLEKHADFKFTCAGIFRLLILPSEDDKNFILIFSLHHAITDGWSVASIISEFVDAYVYDNPINMCILPDYGKYISNEFIALENNTNKEFWLDYLSEYELKSKNLLINHQSKPCNDQVIIDQELGLLLSKKVVDFARELKISPDIIFLGLYNIILSILYNTNDLVVGVVTNNRLEEEGGDRVFGLHLNTIPMRFKTEASQFKSAKDYFLDLLNKKLEVNEHKLYPFGKIKADQGVQGYIYQCAYNYVHFHIAEGNISNQSLIEEYSATRSSVPLLLDVTRSQETFSLSLVGNTDFIDIDTSQKIVSSMILYLEQIISNPDKLIIDFQLLIDADYKRIVYDWNATDKEYEKDKTIHKLFEEQVEKTPNSIALVYEGNELTYNELNEKSNQLARYIREQYQEKTQQLLTPDTLIALFLDRSLEMVIGILAVLKAGGAYVPIDPSYPQERIDYILEDTQAAIVLSQRHLDEKTLPQEKVVYIDLTEELYKKESNTNLNQQSQSTDLAYVIYTSGTTGKPKGVMIEHKAASNTINNLFSVYDEQKIKRVTAYTSYVFDVSVSELFSSLLQGLELHILSNSIRIDSIGLSNYFSTHKINLAYLPPVLLSQLEQNITSDLISLIYAGEPCDKQTAQLWSGKVKLFNYYGPTEASIYAIGKQILTDEVEQIGQPIQNTQAYVLSSNQMPVPTGVIGELYLGGAGLSRGYLNRPELTAERFVNNPFATEADKAKGYTKLYKTGDLVRWLADGNIEYLGRNDDQVKIRGYRIELGEIEHAMSQIDGINQVCVLAKERKTETATTKYLVGYYVLDARELTIDQASIMEKLSRVLPDYMVPSAFVAMESFPLTINGKLDKRALPDPEFTSSEADYVAPTTEIETAVCEIWMSLLELDRVGITDDFFKIGGNSILAIQASHRMSKVLGSNVKVADVFKNRTINNLKDVLSQNLYEKSKNIEGESWEILV